MSIDLSQFKNVFFEESFEGLEVMESHLLDLESSDVEVMHAVFRAAHSIKGGAGMFGYTSIVEFTHLVETLLDELRSEKRIADKQLGTLLLKSCDSIKTLLCLAQDDDLAAPEDVMEIQKQLQNILSADPSSPIAMLKQDAIESTSEEELSTVKKSGWEIFFAPDDHMLQTGNEPLHMFNALAELGDIDVQCDTSKVPNWQELFPEQCYLTWKIQLTGVVALSDVEEVFSWVDGECELTIIPLGDNVSDSFVGQTPDGQTSNSLTKDASNTAECTTKTEEHNRNQSDVVSTETDRDNPSSGERRKSSDRRRSPDRRSSGESNSIRVGIDKIDTLINRVGELVITQSMLSQINASIEEANQQSLDQLKEGLIQLERNTREIQEDVMQIRMLPISFVFNRFPRLVHDLQSQLSKRIELVISGEGTELDKTLMEKISDPLVHLVRNSIDHGIEMPDERKALGKPEVGRVELEAYHQGGNIIIEIRDDGKGLDTEKILQKGRETGLVKEGETPEQNQIFDLIMQPGFSTAEEVSDLSGRGVGMDVVARNINELGGYVEISSEAGKGSCFRISLPLTLAILDGQQVELGEQVYIIPLVSIIESLQVPASDVNAIAGKDRLYSFRGNYIPLVSLRRVMGQAEDPNSENLIVVVEANSQLYGLIVDDLLGQQQFVIKSLEENYHKVEGVAGATILGNGRVGLILDVSGLLRLNRQKNHQLNSQAEHKVLQFKAG